MLKEVNYVSINSLTHSIGILTNYNNRKEKKFIMHANVKYLPGERRNVSSNLDDYLMFALIGFVIFGGANTPVKGETLVGKAVAFVISRRLRSRQSPCTL